MSGRSEALHRLRRVARQRLESLSRSGVLQCRKSPPKPAAALSPSRSPSLDAEATGGRSPPEVERPGGQDSPQSQLAALQRQVAHCTRCEELARTRTQTVFGVGSLSPRLCFLGEAPGADEDRQGVPFVGRAGQLLTDIIQKGMGLRREEVYILNVLKCRPPGNRTPSADEVANCRPFFEQQLAILRPQFICCLGSVAAQALLQTTQSVGRLRGQIHQYQGAKVLVTYHPSYLLRFPEAKKEAWQDIQRLMREMGLPLPPK